MYIVCAFLLVQALFAIRFQHEHTGRIITMHSIIYINTESLTEGGRLTVVFRIAACSYTLARANAIASTIASMHK